jgi:hypothetical protein
MHRDSADHQQQKLASAGTGFNTPVGMGCAPARGGHGECVMREVKVRLIEPVTALAVP